MNKTALTFAFALVCATGVQAKTVLWYHFDEAEPGTATTTATPTILNAVDKTKFPGTPCTMTKGAFSWNLDPVVGAVAGFMPKYTNAFNGASSWFDPVSGERSKDRTCLNMVREYANCTGGANGVGERSMVVVPDPNDELKLQTFTVECFVRFNPENTTPPPGSSIADGEAGSHIISMCNDGSVDHAPWALFAESSGQLDVNVGWNGSRYYAACYPNGSNAGWGNPNWRMSALKDGRWHHVAMTVDGADSTAVEVKVYVDYYNEKTYTMDAPITYAPGASLTIGGLTNHINIALNADIDEVRISDTALTADQFLHPYNVRTDEDTAIYLSFDDWFANVKNRQFDEPGSYYWKFLPTYLNEAGRAGALYCPIILHNDPHFGQPDFVSASCPEMRWNIAGLGVLNGGAYHFAANETYSISQAFEFPNPCQFEHKGGLTVEGFFKMEQPSSSVATTWLLNAVNGGTAWRLLISKNSYELAVCDNWGGVLSTKVLSDNAWHHIAVVSDEAKNEVRLYVDHALVGTKTGFVLSHAPYAAGAEVKPMRFGDLQNTSGIGCYNGFLDEFRYTLRPLEPQEFLTTRTPASDVLASASFEENLAEGPAEYTDLFAAGTLVGSGDYATTRPFKTALNRKSMRLDGGSVSLGRNILLEQDGAFTLEFFLRPETVGIGASVVSLKKPLPSEESVWSVALGEDKATLVVNAGADSLSFALPEVADWWHHYALVVSKSDGLPVVTLYVDHVQIGQPTPLTAALDHSSLSRGLTIGSASFVGWFDELRITKGVLSPEAMMSCSPRLGGLLLLR